jgi:hypothetical protein
MPPNSAIRFSEHADEHRPKPPVLLPVDKKLGDVIIDVPGTEVQ